MFHLFHIFHLYFIYSEKLHACSVMRRDGFIGLQAGYGGAHLPPTQWPQMLTVPLRVPNASACASGDVELRANLLSGVGGGAYFQLELEGETFTNFSLGEAVLLR